MDVYKGNEFYVKSQIKVNSSTININTVDKIEFAFNDTFTKIYPSDDITFNSNYFYIKLTQEETFELDYTFDMQARVKFTTGEIFASNIETRELKNSLSNNII